MKIYEIITDGNMFKGIGDPTVLSFGDGDDFKTGLFDHSYDTVDSSSALRATREFIARPGIREEIIRLAGKVVGRSGN